ncbi:MAG: Na+/H+ antiporter [Dermatophilaceae bacterium]|nr:Na+/H+ antiporter [Intrasporangiaceae bacterium]
MELAVLLVALVATVIAVTKACEHIPVPPPLALLAVGVLGSFLPFVPNVTLTPEIVLFGILPPLLYSTAITTSLYDVNAHKVTIVSLSVGLVLFTALGVGLVVYAILPIPFSLAFAVGAIVAPPDAVAATAVARRIGLPRRITTILEGEALANDAIALVSLRTALAVWVASSQLGAGDAVNPWTPVGSFLWAVAAGIGVGLLASVVIGAVRRFIHDPVVDTALSFLTPFVAYVPAEQIGGSGVLAVIACGLVLAHRAPVLQSAASRMSERTNWAAVTYILENAVFLLIGLQMAAILRAVEAGGLSVIRTVILGLVVLLTVLVLRPIYIFPMGRLSRSFDGDEEHQSRWREMAIASWAGMRGVVTLAAALTLPLDVPFRNALVMVALIVTVGTLLVQGLTLPVLARALGVRGPDVREDALQEAAVLQAATAAGLRAVEEEPTSAVAGDVVDLLRRQSTGRANRVWEQLGHAAGGAGEETPSQAYLRLRLRMLAAEREEVLRIRDGGQVDSAVLDAVLGQLDAEEAALSFASSRSVAVRDEALATPLRLVEECEHLLEEPPSAVPLTPEGCGACLREGTSWVHLRLCTRCGEVGCCDSSEGRHARAHFEETGHPVMRSLEPGESWRWCYVDEALG